MRLRLVWLVVLGVCCLVSATGSFADAARQRIAVLGIEPRDDGDSRSQQRTAALARALTDGLRSRSTQGTAYELAPNGQKDLAELKLLSDCLDEAPECMSAIGRDLGAEVIVYGHLERKRDGNVVVSLRSLSVSSKKPAEITLDRTLTGADATEEGLRRLAPQVFATSSPTVPVPTAHDTALTVDTNVSDGVILVNGVQRGVVTAKKSTVIRGLPPGMVFLAVTSPGHQRAEMSIEVRDGQPTRATLNLEPLGAPGVLAPPAQVPITSRDTARPGGTARVLFWTSLVATGAGVAAFTITGLQVRSIEKEQDDALPGFNFGANGGVMFPNDACREAAADGYDRLVDICDRGKRMATATNVLIGATAVAAVATAIFYWRGYLAPGSSGERADAARKKPPETGLVFGPEIYTRGAGFAASVQF